MLRLRYMYVSSKKRTLYDIGEQWRLRTSFVLSGRNLHCRFIESLNTAEYIEKTCLYNFNPLKPHFYIVKLSFKGVYIIFLSAQKHKLWVLVRTASPSTNMKNIRVFLPENFPFLEVKFSIHLNRRVFVMIS